GPEDTEQRLAENLRRLIEQSTKRPAFHAAYSQVGDEDFVVRVYANASLPLDDSTRTALANELKEKRATRADVLLRVVEDSRFAEREKNRSLVLLHFFAYLHRNPDDPPDKNMDGLLHWVIEMDKGYAPAALSYAFASSFEHQRMLKQARSDVPAEQRR